MDKVFQIESLEAFQNVSNQILSNLYYSGARDSLSSYLEADVITLAKQDLISIISDCNFDLQKIIVAIGKKGWPEEKVKCFCEFLETNNSGVLHAALNHYNSSYCDTVINYDWYLKFVLGTSELKTLKYPVLQLIMSTLNKSGSQNKIMFDINKDVLRNIISALESIK